MADDLEARLQRVIDARLERVAEDVERRMQRLENVVDDGRFVRRDTYEADQRAQERTDLAQERRFTESKESVDAQIAGVHTRVDEIRDGGQWLQRQLIIMLLGILATAAIAALALGAAQ